MSPRRSLLLALVMVAAACSDAPVAPGVEAPTSCSSDEDCGVFQRCDAGACVAGEADAGADEADSGGGEDSGGGGADSGGGEDAGEPLGGFGASCDTGEECASGVCITTAESQGRRQCTDYCDPAGEACPSGFECAAVSNSGADRTFLCFPEADFLCEPCAGDGECGGSSDRCLVYPDGSFCGRSCAERACPAGYDCVEQEGATAQCRLAAGFCSACYDPDDDGYGVGDACRGEDCAEGNPLAHAGADEACNGGDDDCDGQIDEGNPGGGAACNTGEEGICGGGTLRCTDGALACVRAREPRGELCNGQDDDCDGRVDGVTDDAGDTCLTGLPGICGQGVTVCQSATLACVSVQQPRGEECNGQDDNCNGQVDEGNPGGGAACDTGEPGVCATGRLTCANGLLTCPRDVAPRAETCDGLDDACNGVVDDGCPTGISTGDSTQGAAYGGGGGDPFTITCAPGEMAVGVDVRSASELDQIAALCQRITVEEQRGTTPYTYASASTGGVTRTAAQGGGGGSPSTLTCPAGSFLSRMQVRTGSRVDQLTLVCARATFIGYPGAGAIQLTDTSTSTFGGEGGTLRAQSACPAGSFIAGFYGRQGSRVDQLGPICRAYTVDVR